MSLVKPAFLSSMSPHKTAKGGGGGNRKEEWRGHAAKSVVHALSGLAWNDTGQVILWDNPAPRDTAHHLPLAKVKAVAISLCPSWGGKANGVSKGTWGLWYSHGRAYRGGSPSTLGLIKSDKWTPEDKALLVEAACKAVGANPNNVAPMPKDDDKADKAPTVDSKAPHSK